MAAIKSKNTKPEMIIRQGLHALGHRYRLHAKSLPGKPDLAFAPLKAVIFINGCFWHAHECPTFRWPKTRQEWWREKIEGNKARDQKTHGELDAMGWRHAIVWECSLKGKGKKGIDNILFTLSDWLKFGQNNLYIEGDFNGR